MESRFRALQLLRTAWEEKVHGMKKMNQSAQVKPWNPQDVIHLDYNATSGQAKFNCGPVVFNLCERPHGRPKIYVVVEGSICVQEDSSSDHCYQTKAFATRVGYFRDKRVQLHHVYGVHYDMDEQCYGHPVFHAQLRPFRQFSSHIRERFGLDTEVCDLVRPMLRNVRTPVAQMDFFSVFTQLCADHLMGERTRERGEQVNEAFEMVRSACGFLQGAAHRLSYLNSVRARQCYRSSHWYSRP